MRPETATESHPVDSDRDHLRAVGRLVAFSRVAGNAREMGCGRRAGGCRERGEPVPDRPSVGCHRRSPPCRAWSRSDRGTPVRMARSGLGGAISGTARSACETSPALARFGRSGSCLAQLVVKEGICGVDARKTQTRKAWSRPRELLGIGPSAAIRVANRGGCRHRGPQIVASIPRHPPLAVPARREREHPSRAGRRLWDQPRMTGGVRSASPALGREGVGGLGEGANAGGGAVERPVDAAERRLGVVRGGAAALTSGRPPH